MHISVYNLKLVSVPCCVLFGILTCASPLYFQKVSSPITFFLFIISFLPFCTLQDILSKLQSFVSKVWLLYSGSILVLLIYFQWRLSISNKNAHHTMIGTFPLSTSVLSNVKDSNDYCPGVCLPSSRLLSRFSSCEGFR